MSGPSQSMPPGPQYAQNNEAPITSTTSEMNTPSAEGNENNTENTSTSKDAGSTSTSAASATSTSVNSATMNASSSAPISAGVAATPIGGEWRNKDADRGARQHIARLILSLIMKSSNRPASANYNPREIARRLEHTLYMSASSREEYGNVSTLKSRLQQALDNSRRRQMQQQQQPSSQNKQGSQNVTAVSGAGVGAGATATATATATAAAAAIAQQKQSLQQQQLQLLQQQRQQQLHLQRVQQQKLQQLQAQKMQKQQQQQAQFAQAQALRIQQHKAQQTQSLPPNAAVLQMGISAPGATASALNSGTGSSILDELEREADEMANGINDQPLAMPESELQSNGLPMPMSNASTANRMTAVKSNVASANSAGFSAALPLSMPSDMTTSVSAAVTTSTGTLSQMKAGTSVVNAPASSVTSVGTTATTSSTSGTNLYHGMNLSGAQIQQIQQLQQMQQLRRMQQIQQLQQTKANMNVNSGISVSTSAALSGGLSSAVNTATNSISAPGAANAAATTASTGAPGVMPMQMSEASIAQKREELKRRLIQLKHARTCTSGDCGVDYCSRIKVLLAHVSRCANAQCTTIGCKSTRQLLSHFRKCRNLQCDVCSAIRPPMNENEQQLVLRRQQERLCMLRHASTCTLSPCVLPYCPSMKALWKHICECHQRQCRTDHCISSRYVLSHFKQCNKMICEVCGPVRRAIKIIDACKGNLTQLQLNAAQCPDNVRGLIKIMNTMTVVPGSTGAATNLSTAQQQRQAWMAQQKLDGATALDAAKQLVMNNQNASAAGFNANQLKMASTAAARNAAAAGSSSAVVAAANAALSAVNDETALTLEALKKKPLKLQTEKEKKLRRKEQARLAKARTQAKAQQAASLAGNIVQGIVPPKTAPTTAVTTAKARGANVKMEQKKSQQDISFLDSMTEAQLDEHIRSLRFNFCGHISLAELKNRLMPLLTKLMESEYGWAFNNPVDPIQWNIPDYFEIIKCPMDLGTIKKRLEAEHYTSVEMFAQDVRLVFENCIAYNSSTNKFNIAAKQLLASFDKALAKFKAELEKQLFKRCEQRREEMCQLCGGDSFKFAPCMLFCSGPCAGRIRRHTHYYSDPRGEHHWCSSCYKQMKDGSIDMSLLPHASGSESSCEQLTKAMLLKRKNSEVAEEPWVECDSCKLWYHQICALFNERNHAISGEQEPFVCPICVKKQRSSGVKPSIENGLKAKRLPITRMARLIENRVLNSLKQANADEATRMGNLGNAESIGFANASEEPEILSDSHFAVTIREVLSVDKQVQIKPKMGRLLTAKYGDKNKKNGNTAGNAASQQTKSLKRQRMTKKAVASGASVNSSTSQLQLTYRSRCICVFQELDGVDVLIFTLYVQEYGPDSLDPNAGRVYVSYLDSVNYFQPKKLRTLMHQQVMLGFLEDCKNRGFHTAHIWSCPPLKGDDYIFFCKPENQKIPKAARLRAWYQKLLQQAKKDGLVVTISNLYAEYYLKKKAAHDLPYFEGDYWPRLAEDLIKQLEEKAAPPSTTGTRTSNTSSGGNDVNACTKESTSSKKKKATSKSNLKKNGDSTPISAPPALSETSALTSSVGTTEETVVENENHEKTPHVGKHDKRSKKKRTKKGAPVPADLEISTRSSTAKNRSKKSQTTRATGNSKNAVNNDPLMQKLKPILEPQKEDFFVVDLFPKCHKCAQAVIHASFWQLKTVEPSAQVMELLDAVKKNKGPSASSRLGPPPRHYQHYYCVTCYESNKLQLTNRIEVAEKGYKKAEEISSRIVPTLTEKTSVSQLVEVDMQEVKFQLELTFVDPNCPTLEKRGDVANEHKNEKEEVEIKEENMPSIVKTENGEEKSESGVETNARKTTDELKKPALPSDSTSDVKNDAAEAKDEVEKDEVKKDGLEEGAIDKDHSNETLKVEPVSTADLKDEGKKTEVKSNKIQANSAQNESNTDEPAPSSDATDSSKDKKVTSDEKSNSKGEEKVEVKKEEKKDEKSVEKRIEKKEEKKEDKKGEKKGEKKKNEKKSDLAKDRLKKMTTAEDDDVIMPCEIFDTREAFLLYCQNNHCQFDQLRRAKHSSMMVLYHLFNQGTTGFTFTCSSCKINLVSGNRWNCSICPLFNLCDSCNAKTKHEHQLHSFKIVSIPRPGAISEKTGDVLSATSTVAGSVAAGKGTTGNSKKKSKAMKKKTKKTKAMELAELKRLRQEKLNLLKQQQAALQGSTPSTPNPKVTKNPTTGRKRKLTASPTKAATSAAEGAGTTGAPVTSAAISPVVAAAGVTSTAAGQVSGSGGSTPVAGGTPSNGDPNDPNKKQRRIHNVDPQLLLQLEHASSCAVVECTFMNCQRMRAMLKHGAICEQRLAGPCVLCKRIVGLLSAHARQCQKEYTECKVPRCADIRRHFIAQLKARQEQLKQQQLLQQQQLQQAKGATGESVGIPAVQQDPKQQPSAPSTS